MAKWRLLTAVPIAMLSMAAPVAACPFCDSTAADEVRAGIFNTDFSYHVSIAFAPFSVLIALLFLIYHWPSPRASLRDCSPHPASQSMHTPSERT